MELEPEEYRLDRRGSTSRCGSRRGTGTCHYDWMMCYYPHTTQTKPNNTGSRQILILGFTSRVDDDGSTLRHRRLLLLAAYGGRGKQYYLLRSDTPPSQANAMPIFNFVRCFC